MLGTTVPYSITLRYGWYGLACLLRQFSGLGTVPHTVTSGTVHHIVPPYRPIYP